MESDSDAVDALMFFDRLSKKTDLIGRTLAERHNIADALTSTVPDGLVMVCEVSGNLSNLTPSELTLCAIGSRQIGALLHLNPSLRCQFAPMLARDLPAHGKRV